MKNNMFRKVMAASLATAMTLGLASCGGNGNATTGSDSTPAPAGNDGGSSAATEKPADTATPEPVEDVNAFTPITDANGNVIDLGGMEIIVCDWWTQNNAEIELNTPYDEAKYEYQQKVMETYNFKIAQKNVIGWSDIQALTDYVTSNGVWESEKEEAKGIPTDNIVFLLPFNINVPSAISNGLCYNLKTLDCLDFSESKWANGIHKLFATNDAIWIMDPNDPEPRGGLYFNKRLLEEAGYVPDDLYKWVEDGSWTWDKFTAMCDEITADTDNDGVTDRWALCTDDSECKAGCTYSNMGTYIDLVDGKYVFTADSEKTIKGMTYGIELQEKYNYKPEGSEWDYWKTAFPEGKGAFAFGQVYMAANEFKDMQDDFGFVPYPKGPDATDYNYNIEENVYVIPACYDADKAWKIAFALDQWTNPVPGFEDVSPRDSGYYNNFRDTEAVEITIHKMYKCGFVPMHGMVPGVSFGEDYLWGCNANNLPAAAAEACKAKWVEAINAANGN